MEYTRLGRTGLLASRFGLDATSNTKDTTFVKAFESGINIYHTDQLNADTLGHAFFDKRSSVFFASTTNATVAKVLQTDLSLALTKLNTDYIDIYQYYTDKTLPFLHDGNGLYDALIGAKHSGKVHFIGISTQNLDIAMKAADSGLYDTVCFPFNVASDKEVLKLVKLCESRDVGFLASLPLCDGVIKDIPLAFGYLHQYLSVVPLYRCETESTLNQLLYFNDHPPVIDDKFIDDANWTQAFFN